MIYLKEQLIDNIADLGNRCQTILAMINGGPDWLRWAIGNSTMPVCQADSESELLLLIQQGLHSDDMLHFNTFRVSIKKLLSMPDADLEQLAIIRNTDFDTEANLRPLLIRNDLVDYADIGSVTGFVQNQQLENDKLFKCPAFNDMLALAAFVKQLPVTEEQEFQQALLFAQKNAATAGEFIDLYNFFMFAVNNVLPAGLSPLIQTNEVSQLYSRLIPLVFNLLFTSTVGAGKSEMTIRENMQKIILSSRFIGYATCAAAAANLVQNINLLGQDETSVKIQAESYLTTIRNQVSLVPAPRGLLSQDGLFITYKYEDDTALTEIAVSSSGSISLLPATKLKQIT